MAENTHPLPWEWVNIGTNSAEIFHRTRQNFCSVVAVIHGNGDGISADANAKLICDAVNSFQRKAINHAG